MVRQNFRGTLMLMHCLLCNYRFFLCPSSSLSAFLSSILCLLFCLFRNKTFLGLFNQTIMLPSCDRCCISEQFQGKKFKVSKLNFLVCLSQDSSCILPAFTKSGGSPLKELLFRLLLRGEELYTQMGFFLFSQFWPTDIFIVESWDWYH